MDIFGIYLSLSILLITLLAMNISRLRIREKVANGDGKNIKLIKAIRAHTNSLEHLIPFTLILLVLKDYTVSSVTYIFMSFGFLAIRLAHSYSMLNAKFKLRQASAALTYLFELGACILLLCLALIN